MSKNKVRLVALLLLIFIAVAVVTLKSVSAGEPGGGAGDRAIHALSIISAFLRV